MRRKLKYFHLLPFMGFIFFIHGNKSLFRPYDGSPVLTTNWVGKQRLHYLQDSHLEIFPLFKTFDKEYFYQRHLPQTPIPFRYHPDQSIDPHILNEAIENFFYEVRCQKKQYSDFVILKKETFNLKKQAGLLVVRGKTFPLNQFVVKLFMETPRSFIRAYNKGFVAVCHFITGHGATRYMLGFTRLKNLDVIEEMIQDSPEWSKIVDLPRKWFWLPKNYPWIHLAGYHIGSEDQVFLDFPGAYAIIADAIDIERDFSLKNPIDCKMGIDLFNYLQSLIDPHSNNFVIEKETGKIIIIDTEHLPTMVSLKEPIKVDSYRSWYSYLVKKGFQEYFLRTVEERKKLQAHPVEPYKGPEKYVEKARKKIEKLEKNYNKHLKEEEKKTKQKLRKSRHLN